MCMGGNLGDQAKSIFKTTTLGGNPMANLAIAGTILGGMGLSGMGAGLGASGAGAAGDTMGSSLLNAGAGAMDANGFAGMGMAGAPPIGPITAAAPLPLDSPFAIMGGGVNPYVPGTGTGMSPSMMGKMGMNMMQQGMQQQQPSPMAAQRPPGMQQQPQQPAGIQGMLNQPPQPNTGAGAQDIMARLRAMGMI